MASTTLTRRPTPLDMPQRRPEPKIPVRPPSGRICYCGQPATEYMKFSDGDSDWFCRPCS